MAELSSPQELARRLTFKRADDKRKKPYTGPRNETIKQFLLRTVGPYDRTTVIPALIGLDQDDRFLLTKDPDAEYDASPRRALETAHTLVRRLRLQHMVFEAERKTYAHAYSVTRHAHLLRALAAEMSICAWIERKLGRKAQLVINEDE